MIGPDELQFFNAYPQLLPLYLVLREKLEAKYPDMGVKVSKTQISLRNRHVFAMASLPFRKIKGWPREYLLVSFGLSCRNPSPRIAQSVEAYPGRWTHHVVVTAPEDIDGELLGWIDEAWQFAMNK